MGNISVKRKHGYEREAIKQLKGSLRLWIGVKCEGLRYTHHQPFFRLHDFFNLICEFLLTDYKVIGLSSLSICHLKLAIITAIYYDLTSSFSKNTSCKPWKPLFKIDGVHVCLCIKRINTGLWYSWNVACINEQEQMLCFWVSGTYPFRISSLSASSHKAGFVTIQHCYSWIGNELFK